MFARKAHRRSGVTAFCTSFCFLRLFPPLFFLSSASSFHFGLQGKGPRAPVHFADNQGLHRGKGMGSVMGFTGSTTAQLNHHLRISRRQWSESATPIWAGHIVWALE